MSSPQGGIPVGAVTDRTSRNSRITRLQATLNTKDGSRVGCGSTTTSQRSPGGLKSDTGTPGLRTMRIPRTCTANKDLPTGTWSMGAKRGTEAVELNILSKPKRQRTATAKVIEIQAQLEARQWRSKGEFMGREPNDTSGCLSELKELPDLDVNRGHGHGVPQRFPKLRKAKDTPDRSMPKLIPTAASIAVRSFDQIHTDDREATYGPDGDLPFRIPPTLKHSQPSTVTAGVGRYTRSMSSVRRQTMLRVATNATTLIPHRYHALSNIDAAGKGRSSGTPEVTAGVSRGIYSKMETNKGSVRRLDTTLTYLLATRQAISPFAGDPFKQYFADKKASLNKKLDFLVDNIAAYCHDGTTVRYKAWEKNGCPQFNGIPVLSRHAPLWGPVEEGPNKSQNVTPRVSTSHANSSRKDPTSALRHDTTELPGSTINNPILVDDDSGSQGSRETAGDPSSTRPSPTSESHVDPQSGEPELHGLTEPENERLRDHCMKRGALLEASFHILCDRLNIPRPHNNSQIRRLGFTANALAHEFLLEFPSFCEPIRVSALRVKVFLESIFSYHLSGPDFYRLLSTCPHTQLPILDPTLETKSSVAHVDAATSQFEAQESPPEADLAPHLKEEDDGPPAKLDEISLTSNKKPRKGKRTAVQVPLFDDYLYEQRLKWQRNAWDSTRPLDFIAAARGDRDRMRSLHHQREITRLKQLERDIANELQEMESKRIKSEVECSDKHESKRIKSEVEHSGKHKQLPRSPPADWQQSHAIAAKNAEFPQRTLQLTTEAIATARTKAELLEDKWHEVLDKPSEKRTEEDQSGYYQWRPIPYGARGDKAELLRDLVDWAKVVGEPASPVFPSDAPRKRKKRLKMKRGWY